jgi:hypothetical protein
MLPNIKDENTIRVLVDDKISLDEKIIDLVLESLHVLSLARFYLNADDTIKIEGIELEAIRIAVNKAYSLLSCGFELHTRTH